MSLQRIFLILCGLAQFAHAQTLTLPLDQRPEWIRRDGIVMAGSWEALPFRLHQNGKIREMTPAEQTGYLHEHSPEMIARLIELGVNFVMMHAYKGAGLETERQSMADSVRFARLCHEAGLRVGVYNYSGAFLWQVFFKEMPEASNWIILDEEGQPVPYSPSKTRYYWNRNHPDAEAFYKKLIHFAVKDIQADLLHFDNYLIGPGYDAFSVRHFREHLRKRFSSEQLARLGIADPDALTPPKKNDPNPYLQYVWRDYCCQALADSYHDMGRYARSLRPDILLECNPGGVNKWTVPPIDHARLLTGGEAFWHEGREPLYSADEFRTRIRNFKVARLMNNILFTYTTGPLAMAESMAFNLDFCGCICWFQFGDIRSRPGEDNHVSEELAPFIRFFHERRELFRDAEVIADAAILRSFPSQVFADPRWADLTYRVEQTLIESCIPFQIIYDQHLVDPQRYKTLVLAGCVAMSDQQLEQVCRFVKNGGRLCIIGPAATHDEWMFPREKSPLADLSAGQVVRIEEEQDVGKAIRRACVDRRSLSIEPPPGLCLEFTRQPDRLLVHLVNYHLEQPAEQIKLQIPLPKGSKVSAVSLAGPEQTRDLDLPFVASDGSVTFTVPKVKIYAIAAVTLASENALLP